jgi:hypothetical protein
MILTQREEYTLSAEFLWFGVVLHNEIHVRYTKTVKKRLVQDLRLIANSISSPIFVFQTMTHDPLKMKFIESLGCFSFDHYRTTGEGEWAKMYILRPLEVQSGFFRSVQRSSCGKPIQIKNTDHSATF